MREQNRVALLLAENGIKIALFVAIFSIIGLYCVAHFQVMTPAIQKNKLALKAKERSIQQQLEEQANAPIQNGIHQATGFIADKGLPIVISTCTACHSAKLVTQNRASKEGWKDMIRWMQKTQNLWDLGEQEEIILNYLAKNYGPEKTGRRKPLQTIEWYDL